MNVFFVFSTFLVMYNPLCILFVETTCKLKIQSKRIVFIGAGSFDIDIAINILEGVSILNTISRRDFGTNIF